MSIFRAYDIRGIVGESLTEEIVTQVGQAIGSEAAARNRPQIVVARDGRLSGPNLIEALIEGLQAAGREVIDIGMMPTPVLYFATYYLKTGSGVMLTGSHNPPNYNGLKIMLGGETLSGEAIQALKTRIDNGDLITGSGFRHTTDIHHAYISHIHKEVKLARPFKVVVDSGNGVAGVVAPHLMQGLGCEVVKLFCEVDGHFPNHHPDPSMPENLEDLKKAVLAEGADLGLAFDGDGDRLGVVDAKGRIIWPDRQMILYATDLLKRHPGAQIIYDVKCTRHLANAIEQNGGKPKMWKTGHSFIKSEIKKSGALLGGEMSGHIFFKERWFGFDDALYTAARLLEILSQDSRTPEEVFAAIPDAVNTPELKLEMTEFGEHYKLMQKIRDTFHFEGAEIATIDGIRADFKDGWGLVRPSNTTPCLVIRFEADNQAALNRIQEEFRRQFLAIDSTLKLPF
ncbi:MAG TPA: phosphomannomutase/phosphoglucomutase [Beggiatoa sp.]|nr:MAG: phosphomannomutase/phosphoglucomutase [Beggiatoa sp. 4572_84]RKZ59468.1 MAG: phosphomannomutase/phosphoglucomutase [Gammaproteobacteria bacterium]HEW98300.1 phosphomannomutase/phosphoglucomutase [Beggiatoa sp.]